MEKDPGQYAPSAPTDPGYTTQPAPYGGQPPPYPQQQYGAQPGQYGTQPGQYGAQPGQYGAQPGQYGAQPGQYGAPASGNTVIVTQPNVPVVYAGEIMPDSTGAIIFSCVVTWCCCCILGIIAFVFAVTARDSGIAEEARRKLQISTRLSIAGLVIGIVVYVIITAVRIAAAAAYDTN